MSDKNKIPEACEHCGSKDFKQIDTYYDEIGEVEFTLKCEKCNLVVGSWAYGHWD